LRPLRRYVDALISHIHLRTGEMILIVVVGSLLVFISVLVNECRIFAARRIAIARVYAIVRCLSVCSLSVTVVYWAKRLNRSAFCHSISPKIAILSLEILSKLQMSNFFYCRLFRHTLRVILCFWVTSKPVTLLKFILIIFSNSAFSFTASHLCTSSRNSAQARVLLALHRSIEKHVYIAFCVQAGESSGNLSTLSMKETIAFGSSNRKVAVYKGLKVAVYTVGKTDISLTRHDLIDLINVRKLLLVYHLSSARARIYRVRQKVPP